ncbi:hypothetical protein D3C75_1298280 [compost metagenome]
MSRDLVGQRVDLLLALVTDVELLTTERQPVLAGLGLHERRLTDLRVWRRTATTTLATAEADMSADFGNS